MLNLKYNNKYQVENLMRSPLRRFIGKYPQLYFPLKKIQGKYGLVSHRTEIVIEGYPRCANSFAEAAFLVAQGRDMLIAHHTHASAQILAGIKYNIPILVLFREPDDAVISRIIHNSNLSLKNAYLEYISFYKNIWHVIDKCVISSFEQTTGSFGNIIESINNKYDTNFNKFNHDVPAMVEKVNDLIDKLSIQRTGRVTNYSDRNTEQQIENRKRKKDQIIKYLDVKRLHNIRKKAKQISEQLYEKCI